MFFFNQGTKLHFLEKKVVHIMEKPCMWPPMPLLVISPRHGQACYTWERKTGPHTEKWESINVPPYTAILYIDTAMQYRCTVDDTSVVINVQGKWHMYNHMHVLRNNYIAM